MAGPAFSRVRLFSSEAKRRVSLAVAKEVIASFDPAAFLASAGLGRTMVLVKAKRVFCQGAAADCVFYLQSGRAKLTVVSNSGKEATITLLNAGDFVGEESLAGVVGLRMATATAITNCEALKIDRSEMVRSCWRSMRFRSCS